MSRFAKHTITRVKSNISAQIIRRKNSFHVVVVKGACVPATGSRRDWSMCCSHAVHLARIELVHKHEELCGQGKVKFLDPGR